MSRLIDADKLIEQIKKTYCEGCDNYNGVRCKACPNDDEIGDIDSAPTIEAVNEWIPCSERLPKDLEVVNITWINHRPMTYYADIKDEPFAATAIHYKDKWWWYSPICEDMLAEYGESECDKMDDDIEVTAWMPLPKPYGREE